MLQPSLHYFATWFIWQLICVIPLRAAAAAFGTGRVHGADKISVYL